MNTDRFDDEDDLVSERPRKSISALPAWAIVLLCAFPVLLIVLAVGGMTLFWSRALPPQQAEALRADAAAADAAMRKVYTRDEFKTLVMGKTPDEVIAAVGKPNSTSDLGKRTLWIFNNRTTDPITGKIDFTTTVAIEGGRVVFVVN